MFFPFLFIKQIQTMKFHLYAIGLALSVLCPSCSDSDTDPAPVQPGDGKVSISATLENGRTWSAGDEVLINGAKYTIAEGAGTSTAIVGDVDRAERYCGAYDIGTGRVSADGKLSLALPAVQNPSTTPPQPMVASNRNTTLTFKYLLGRLRLNLTGEKTITRLTLSTTSGEKIAGNGSVDLDFSGNPVLEMASDAVASVTVEFGSGIPLSDTPAPVDLWLPALGYAGFSLTVYDSEGGVMIAKALPAVEVKRGEIVTADVAYEPADGSAVYLRTSVETAADGTAYNWTSGSAIYVNGVPVPLYAGEGTTVGEFGPVEEADTYYATTSSASVNGFTGTMMRVNIPVRQNYGVSLASLNPAAAVSTSNVLEMKYVAGVAELQVTGPHLLRSIELQSKGLNDRLAGDGVLSMTASDFALSLNADASRSIVVDCGSAGVSTAAGAVFRFVMPAAAYADGFSVVLTDGNGQVYNAELEGVAVARNGIAKLGDVLWEGEQGSDNDLSLYGAANCYMVHLPGTYTFRTRRVDNTPVQNIAKVDWLWATAADGATDNRLVSDISYADGVVTFTASEERGNVLLAAFDEAGEIVWSWHIWLTEMPRLFDYENNPVYQSGGKTDGYYFMDRHLGAAGTSGQEAYGLLYQWGRKDPFIGGYADEAVESEDGSGNVVTLTDPFSEGRKLTVVNSAYAQAGWQALPSSPSIGKVEYAIAHPMDFLYAGPTANQSNWLDVSNIERDWKYDADKSLWRPFQKTNYDPCPPGYQIPRDGSFRCMNTGSMVYTAYSGVMYPSADGDTWYPFQGMRSAHPQEKGALRYVAEDSGTAYVWTSEVLTAEQSGRLMVHWPLIDNYQSNPWGDGMPVRCVKAYN